VPAAYVEEVAAPPVAAARPPPPPPARPAAGRKPAALQPRDSGMSLNGSESSRSNTPTPTMAGGLAEALLARKNAMASKKAEEDDW
jgi:myosin-1